MKKRKTILAVLVAGWLFILSGTAAWAHGPGPGMGPGMIPLQALIKLGLTDAQKAKIANIILASKTEMATVRKKHEEIENIMKPVLVAAAFFNEANIRAACQKSASLMADIMIINAKIASQVRSVLTEEQRQALCDGRKKGGKRMPPPVFDGMQEEVLKAWLAKTATE